MVIIHVLLNFVVFEYQILYIKFEGKQPVVLEEKIF